MDDKFFTIQQIVDEREKLSEFKCLHESAPENEGIQFNPFNIPYQPGTVLGDIRYYRHAALSRRWTRLQNVYEEAPKNREKNAELAAHADWISKFFSDTEYEWWGVELLARKKDKNLTAPDD